MRGAPRRLRLFFVCSYVGSPFDPLRTEKTADFSVILLLIYANRQKFWIFYAYEEGGSKKGDFQDFWGVFFVGRLQPTQNIRFARKKHGLLVEMS